MGNALPPEKSYPLTVATIAANAGASGIVCLDVSAEGRTFRLYSSRPGPSRNMRRNAAGEWSPAARADLPSGSSHTIAPVEAGPVLIRVDIRGPLEQQAGYHDPCAGWSDGHDAVADRLCAAFAEGDVLLMIDSPGGAAAGLQQNLARAQAAKAKFSRRCTVFADEQIGSAATWWAMGIGDAMFAPPAGQIGSIGARGAHRSIAAMLAKDGVEFTYFVWPNAGKVAFAPELPLSAEAKARGDRDVRIAGEAFCAAVCASVIGQRHGLTPESVAALSADMLTGQAAVDAGLCDGVASIEDVTKDALAYAARGTETTATGAASATGERAMPKVRAEGDEPDKDGDEEKATGTKPTGVCAKCGTGNPVAHKFCAQCGESMAAEPLEDPAPPSSKPAAALAAVKPMSLDASTAAILDASSEAPLALRTAAVAMRHDRDRLRAELTRRTGGDGVTTDEIIGRSLTMPSAARAAKEQAKVDDAEKRALVARGVATGSAKMTAGDAYIPRVSAAGERLGTDLAPQFAEMSMGTLRGLVAGLEASTPKRNPFEPSRVASKAASDAATGEGATPESFTAAERKALENHPDAQLLVRRGSALSAHPSKMVDAIIASNPSGARAWLAQNGSAS